MITFVKSVEERDAMIQSLMGFESRSELYFIREESEDMDSFTFQRPNSADWFRVFRADESAKGEIGGNWYEIYLMEDPAKHAEQLLMSEFDVEIDDYIRFGDLRKSNEIIDKNTSDISGFWDVLKSAARFYAESYYTYIVSCTAMVVYSSGRGLTKAIVESSMYLDIYISMGLYSPAGKSGEVCFNLSDFYRLDGYNEDEVRRIAYRSWIHNS